MNRENPSNLRNGYCIYIRTFCQEPVPVVSDDDAYVVFETRWRRKRKSSITS
jgi:hypothetical protein